MQSITIDKRFRGPPTSANGGYVCGLVASAMGGSGEVTLRAPPPLGHSLEIVRGTDGSLELRNGQTLLATGRPALPHVGEIPAASFAEAEEAARRSPFADQGTHLLPDCFVCGPARAEGDGLRLFVGPLSTSQGRRMEALAAPWVPSADLAGVDGRVSGEFIWSALDCPTGFAGMNARQREPILLGRMAAHVDQRPRPGERCVVVAWPTGRDGRKLFASGALLGHDGETLAVAHATWLVVDRQVQLGQR
jgi:hypothetical protein